MFFSCSFLEKVFGDISLENPQIFWSSGECTPAAIWRPADGSGERNTSGSRLHIVSELWNVLMNAGINKVVIQVGIIHEKKVISGDYAMCGPETKNNVLKNKFSFCLPYIILKN